MAKRIGCIGEDEIVASRVVFVEETERDSYFRNRTSCLYGRQWMLNSDQGLCNCCILFRSIVSSLVSESRIFRRQSKFRVKNSDFGGGFDSVHSAALRVCVI